MDSYRFFEGGKLPSVYKSDAGSVALNTDFKLWLRFAWLNNSNSLDELQRLTVALFPDGIQSLDTKLVGDACAWFLSCGDSERIKALGGFNQRVREGLAKRKKKSCLYWDFYELWSSFKEQYGIDLYTCEELHWWEFKRLLNELEANRPFNQIERLRKITRAEFMGDDKGMRSVKVSEWEDVVLEQFVKGLP